jgi:uncharacterized protein YndB with AHSA1/START domain
MGGTRMSRHIRAPRSAVYAALLDSAAIERWRAPEGMIAHVRELDAREGGGFRVSLRYEVPTGSGKSDPRTDTYSGRYARLVPDEQVVEELEFASPDPAFRGKMTITTTLREADGATDVRIVHEGLPDGVSPADNETGTRMALANLAALLEDG